LTFHKTTKGLKRIIYYNLFVHLKNDFYIPFKKKRKQHKTNNIKIRRWFYKPPRSKEKFALALL